MGNAVRFRKPTRRKNPFKIFCITLLILAILAVAGYFAYGYVRDKFFSAPTEPEKPEIIYIIEEKDPPPPPVVEVQEEAEVVEEQEAEVVTDETVTENTPAEPENIQTEEPVNEVDN